MLVGKCYVGIISPHSLLTASKIRGSKGFLGTDSWEDLESRTPIMVPHTTIRQFLGTLKRIDFLDLPRGLGDFWGFRAWEAQNWGLNPKPRNPKP